MACITQNESIRFVNKMVRQGINIMNPPFINAYSSLGSRQRTKMSNTIVEAITHHESYPAFYMLNLVIDDKSVKHSMLLVLDKIDDGYVLELFDSNGELDRDYIWEDNVLTLIDMILPSLETELETTVSFAEVRAGLDCINTVGGGNCDALTLYYASLRTKLSMSQSNDILDESPMSKKRIDSINQIIRTSKLETWI